MSVSAVGALERGERRAPYRETIVLLADALVLSAPERAELEAAAERGRARQRRADAETPLPNNLPARLTSFVGRDDEIGQLRTLLENHRLVTVTGPGGIGKTRLALEVAELLAGERFPQVCFVDFSPLADEAFVTGTIAAALEVSAPEAVDPFRGLAARLKTRRLLLILDNCEHIIASAVLASAAILRACPDITILATSRERLAVTGERVFRLPTLSEPSALQLLLERAAAIEACAPLNAAGLRTGAEICRRLEGIPLAIELAATRLPSLGVDALNERLKEHALTTRGARDLPQRQQTMLDTIAWSYDLLSEDERMVLRRLAIFRGGITIEGATAVCGPHPDLVALLVDKSLLIANFGEDGSCRYEMLESVREFASAKLREAAEFEASARAHALWVGAVADRAHERYLEMPRGRWLAEVMPELDNVRSALQWCLGGERDDDALLAARILGGLRGLWFGVGMHVECRKWVDAVLPRIDLGQHPEIAARVLRAEIQTTRGAGKFAAAERAIPVFERIGDRQGLVFLHSELAMEHSRLGEIAEADRLIDKAFALADQAHMQDSPSYVSLLQFRCGIHAHAGRVDPARADLARAARLQAAVLEVDDRAWHLYYEAYISFVDGNVQRSLECSEAFVAHDRAKSREIFGGLELLASAHLVLGHLELAERTIREATEAQRFAFNYWPSFWCRAAVAAVRGHPHTAARLFGYGEAKYPLRDPVNRVCCEIMMASLREQLTPVDIETLIAEGSRLDIEQAFEEALSI